MRHPSRLFVWTLAIALFGAWVGQAWAQTDKNDDYYRLMERFVDTFEQIDRNYVREVDREKLLEAAIRGMMSELDQYSNYISPEDLARFEQEVEQEFGGIGIQVSVDPQTRALTIMTPLPGTPAYRAGLKAGDVIVEIEDKKAADFPRGQELETAVKLLKGPPGEKVTVGVRHLGSDKVERVTLVRDIIRVATVLGDKYNPDGTWDYMLDDEKKIGYIRLTHFSRHSAEELEKALTSLKSQNMRGLILDLRFNPGGLLSQAVKIADLFVDDGVIVSTRGRNSEPREWRATKSGTFTGFPMAVLVNRYSASASEILSACLQDHKRAVVVGERTWGKGSVQSIIELDHGKSALKLTTASYHRPSGKNIHRFPGAKESDVWGVMPSESFEVKMSTKQLQEYLDYRRERDVLKEGGPPSKKFDDPQLARALKYIEEKIQGTAETTETAPPPSLPKGKPRVSEQAGPKSSAAPARKLIIPPRMAA